MKAKRFLAFFLAFSLSLGLMVSPASATWVLLSLRKSELADLKKDHDDFLEKITEILSKAEVLADVEDTDQGDIFRLVHDGEIEFDLKFDKDIPGINLSFPYPIVLYPIYPDGTKYEIQPLNLSKIYQKILSKAEVLADVETTDQAVIFRLIHDEEYQFDLELDCAHLILYTINLDGSTVKPTVKPTDYSAVCPYCQGLGHCSHCSNGLCSYCINGYTYCTGSNCLGGICLNCSGLGYTTKMVYTKNGYDIKEQKCGICNGSGQCQRCGGLGQIKCIHCGGSGVCSYCKGAYLCAYCGGTGTR